MLSLRGSREAGDEVVDATQWHNPINLCNGLLYILMLGAVVYWIASPASRDRNDSILSSGVGMSGLCVLGG